MQRKLTQIFKSAVTSVNPAYLIKSGVKINSGDVEIFGNTYSDRTNFHVIGFGKAVPAMVNALQDILQHRIKSGGVSVPIFSSCNVNPPVRVYYGAKNNIPDENSVNATDEILRLAEEIPTKDVVIVLISGGGSSLFCKPVSYITLEDKTLTIKLLTQCGADINEMNYVRTALSKVKGGQFGLILNKSPTICLILSDVIGDPLNIIASGPTVASSNSTTAAIDVIDKYKLQLKLPKHVLNHIKQHIPLKQSLENVKNIIIGSNAKALEQSKHLEETDHCKIFILASNINGNVSDVAAWYVQVSMSILKLLHEDNARGFFDSIRALLRERNCKNIIAELLIALKNPKIEMVTLLLGGETTVKVKGKGKGGRNQELAVLFAQSVYGLRKGKPNFFKNWDVSLLCAGTDGIDGPTDAAGGIGCAELMETALAHGLRVDTYLANNDTNSLLSKLENGKYLVTTGHTGTNVMDIHALGFCRRSILSRL